MVGGLWAGAHTQVGDFATVVYRAQLLGFNAVRLPFRCAAVESSGACSQCSWSLLPAGGVCLIKESKCAVLGMYGVPTNWIHNQPV